MDASTLQAVVNSLKFGEIRRMKDSNTGQPGNISIETNLSQVDSETLLFALQDHRKVACPKRRVKDFGHLRIFSLYLNEDSGVVYLIGEPIVVESNVDEKVSLSSLIGDSTKVEAKAKVAEAGFAKPSATL